MIDFDTFKKLPKNVRDLGKLIVAKGFKKLPKVQKIAQSGHTAPLVEWSIPPLEVHRLISVIYKALYRTFITLNCWKDIFNFNTNRFWKNVHPVYGAGIRTQTFGTWVSSQMAHFLHGTI